MSQENGEIIRKAFEGRLEETAATYWHPEVEYVEDPRWPGAARYKGRDAVLRCFRNYMEALGREEDLVVTVERVLDGGARQVPLVRVQSRASTSGVPHEHLWGYVVEVREERIVYFLAYYEPAEALQPWGWRGSRCRRRRRCGFPCEPPRALGVPWMSAWLCVSPPWRGSL